MKSKAASNSARAEPAWEPRGLAEAAAAPAVDPVDCPLGAARAQVHETYRVAQTRDGVVIVDRQSGELQAASPTFRGTDPPDKASSSASGSKPDKDVLNWLNGLPRK